VQVIALISYLHLRRMNSPFLIVGPLSTVGNWVAEFARFSPSVRVVKYRGTIDERQALREEHIPKEAYTTGKLSSPMPVFIMSFESAMRDEEHLARVKWRMLVLDEGHRIKNEKSALRSVMSRYHG